jgi:hypothetical protein
MDKTLGAARPVRKAATALALGLAVSSAAAAADRAKVVRSYASNTILCLAGCDGKAPAVVGHSSLIPARPIARRNPIDDNLVLRDVWCGDTGGCIALNHVAPPRLRDHEPWHSGPTIAVHHYWW